MQTGAAPEVIADRYELGALLGRGGMGEVREGLDLRLGRPVAIKLLRADLAAEPELRRRFESEARAAAGLSHPNVVAVYDTGEHDGTPYIVMERLAGRTVADEIADGTLSADKVERMAREVLAALDAAHRAGVVHRDIKPGNLLLCPDGSVKVADFGIAKVAEGLGPDVTVTGQVVGTPAYLAPERLDGRPGSARSDLFSLGVVMYEALSGAKPFQGATSLATAQAIVSGEHQPLDEARPGLPPTLVATVERSLQVRPEDRFATAADMAASLDDHAASPAASTRAATASTRAGTRSIAAPGTAAPGTAVLEQPPEGRRPGPRPWAVPLAVLAAVIVLVVAVGLLTRDSGPADVAPTPPPSTAPAAGSVPEPLDRAIARLEESVRP